MQYIPHIKNSYQKLTRIQIQNILTPIIMASTIAAACGTGATTECGLSEVPPGVSKKPSDLSQATYPKPMTYIDKKHMKHKTSLKKSPQCKREQHPLI